MPFRAAPAAALTLLLATAPRLDAQGWTLGAAAGRAIHDPIDARIGSTTASLSVGYDGGVRAPWLYLSGGTPLGDPGPAWGAAGAGGWLGVRRGALYAGLAGGVNGWAYGAEGGNDAGGGATLDLAPTVGWDGGRAWAEASVGGIGIADVVGDSTATRAFLDAGARLGVVPAPGLRIAGEGRYLAGEDGAWPYAGGSASLAVGPARAWGFGGAWLKDDDLPSPTTAYGFGASVRILPGTDLSAEWRQDPVDPVYFNAPRRAWTVQLRRQLGGGPSARTRAPAFAPEVAGEEAVFRLPLRDHVRPPFLLGDFTEWKPVEMRPEGEHWVARARVLPGVYHYGFRRWGGEFFVPRGVPQADDGMGGRSAVLVVP